MPRLLPSLFTGLALSLISNTAFAQSWDLDPAASRLAFGSIKKNTVGEVHTFERISGTVSDSGAVEISIDLTSVQTFIDIRNERMREFVFGGKDTASLKAQIDVAGLKSLPIGGSGVFDTEVTLSLLGNDVALDAELFVLRLAEDRVMVSTDGMVFLNMQMLVSMTASRS